jgi:hypothetical protein
MVFLALGARLVVVHRDHATGVLDGSFQRGMVHAFLAAHREPGICADSRSATSPSWKSGGYTYLNRDVPLMFDPYVPEVRLPGCRGPAAFHGGAQGGPVPQFRSPYSHVIAEAAHPPAGFDRVECFPDDARPGEPELCLFRRPGGCF